MLHVFEILNIFLLLNKRFEVPTLFTQKLISVLTWGERAIIMYDNFNFIIYVCVYILLFFLMKIWGCLVHVFKQQFSNFKQHYMYFYTLFYPHV